MGDIDKFFKAKEKLFEHVGLELKLYVITEMRNGEHYEDDIYTQRFYPKWVYRGKDVTLIFCNPHIDGCIWWKIFDNKKELEGEE